MHVFNLMGFHSFAHQLFGMHKERKEEERTRMRSLQTQLAVFLEMLVEKALF